MGTPHSPKLQHYWNVTIKLFSVIFRTLVGGGVLPLSREAVSVFYSPSRLGNSLSESYSLSLLNQRLNPKQRGKNNNIEEDSNKKQKNKQ